MAGTTNPNDEPLDLEGLRETMSFDPFGPASDTGAGGDDGQEGGKPDGEDTPPAGDPPKPEGEGTKAPPAKEPAPAPARQPSTQAPSGGDDKDQVIEGLRAQIANLLAQPPQAKPAEPAKPAKAEEDKVDDAPYKLQVAPELVAGMLDDDPHKQQQAVSALANAVMNKMYQDFRGALVEMERRILGQLPTVIDQTQTVKTAQQQIEEDFYGAFPELNKPMLRDAVWGTVKTIGERMQAKAWTPELRDTAGHYLMQQLGLQRVAAPPAQETKPPAPAAKPPARRTFAAGSGANGGGRANDSDANQFADVLGVGGF